MMYNYRAKVERVVDGDTIDLEWWDLGAGVRLFPTSTKPLRMRFAGIDAYETSLRGDTTPEEKLKGIEAREWLRREIEGKRVRIRTVLDGETGSFGRFLVWVWPDCEPDEMPSKMDSYNYELIRKGYAVQYER